MGGGVGPLGGQAKQVVEAHSPLITFVTCSSKEADALHWEAGLLRILTVRRPDGYLLLLAMDNTECRSILGIAKGTCLRCTHHYLPSVDLVLYLERLLKLEIFRAVKESNCLGIRSDLIGRRNHRVIPN